MRQEIAIAGSAAKRTSPLSRFHWPFAVGAFAGALYLSIPAAKFNFDGVACAISIELGDPRFLVHGNHVAYGALGWLTHAVLGLFGYGGPALASLQVLSSLLGAAGVAAFCLLLLNLGFAPPLAAAASAGLAVSRLYWTWSLEAQVYPLGCAFMLFAAAELAKGKPRPEVAGLLQAGAILGHVGHLMLAPAAWALLPDARSRRRWAAALVGATTLGYLVAVVFFVRPGSFSDLRGWLLGSTALSVDRRFMWLGSYSLAGLGHWVRVTLELLSGSAAVGVFAWAAAAWGAADARGSRPRAARLAVLWLAAYAVLYANWQPYTVVYRYSDVAALWLLLACAVDAATREAKVAPRLQAAAVAAFVVFLGVWNWGAAVLPGSDPGLNPDLQRSLWVARETPEDSWIVVHATDQVYIPYFAHRKPLNIRYFPDAESLQARVAAVRKAGEPVYVVPRTLPEWAGRALAESGWRETAARGDERLYLVQ